MPGPNELTGAGVQVLGGDEIDDGTEQGAKGQRLGHVGNTNPQWQSVGTGFPALTKKMIKKIRANTYIDFAELPPAKGKSRSLPQILDGQVVVVQAADLLQARNDIPNPCGQGKC